MYRTVYFNAKYARKYGIIITPLTHYTVYTNYEQIWQYHCLAHYSLSEHSRIEPFEQLIKYSQHLQISTRPVENARDISILQVTH